MHWWEATLSGETGADSSPIERGGSSAAGLVSPDGADGAKAEEDDIQHQFKHANGIQKHFTRIIDDLKVR